MNDRTPQGTNGDDAAFSRSAVASPFGKLDRELKTHLDEHTYLRLLELCASVNVLPGVFVRELVYRRVHGQTLTQLAAERMARQIDGEGPIQGQGGAS